MRPGQWVKNGFVLMPLVFSGQFTDPASIVAALWATLLFCLASSAAYIVNDYHDIEHDKRHQEKFRRPLASGQVSKPQAFVLLGVLYAALAGGAFWYPELAWVIIAYLVLNLVYSFTLKHQPVIDIFIIALGFVLRLFAGAVVLLVPVSPWMFVTTLALALYLAAIKRRQELLHSGKEGRKVLEHYSVDLINRYAEMSATGALLFYSLFVITVHPEMVATIPFVLYGLFRYWFVVDSLDGGESPTDTLLADWQLTLTTVAWLGVSIWILWP